ncbi:helix-turn-helix domain-containing protein [Larkinella sp.]|uniref:helix-turn-helix domain-containing protein n=1 Tax=Larkinella sp. TaxID=2034517 RepID=UPI003BAABD70
MAVLRQLQIEQMDAQTFNDRLDRFEKLIISMGERISPSPIVTYITREQVAKKFGVSLVTLWSWEKAGIIQGYRLGNLVRYREDEIDTAPVRIQYKKTK